MSRPASASLAPFGPSKRTRTASSHADSADRGTAAATANESGCRAAVDDPGTQARAQALMDEDAVSKDPAAKTQHHHRAARTIKRTRLRPISSAAAAVASLVPHKGTFSSGAGAFSSSRAHRHGKGGPCPRQHQHPPMDQDDKRPPHGQQHYALPSNDDEEGHLLYALGDGIYACEGFPQGRYKILSDLGEGTFGKVVECWDRSTAMRVAIKIVRSVAKYRDAARLEIDVLYHLELHDPDGLHHCVRFLDWFDHEAHVCIVFEKLGPSLYDQLRRNRFRPFSLEFVREFAYQLLESVSFIHSLTLIHTDLKPENILLADPEAGEALSILSSKQRRMPVRGGASGATTKATSGQMPSTRRRVRTGHPSAAIRLIDFGSATFNDHHHSAVISTRHYRAPEVILGLGWTYPCDLWSVGCILVELYTGQALFQTHENLEHLAMMRVVLGPFPDSMICRADCYGQKYFIAAAPEYHSPPLPSDRPPNGSGKRQRKKIEDIQHTVLKRKRSSLSRSGLLPPRLLSRRVDKADPYYRAHGDDGVGPTATSSASASGSMRATIVEEFERRDELLSPRPKRALNWPAGASSDASRRAVRRMKPLAEIVRPSEDHREFLDLLRRLLAFEPRERCTAFEALSHPFFHEAPTDADIGPSNQGVAPTFSSGGESPHCESQGTLSAGGLLVEGRSDMYANEDTGPGDQCAVDPEPESSDRQDLAHHAASLREFVTMAPQPAVPTYAEDRSEFRLTAAEYNGESMRTAGGIYALDGDDCARQRSQAQRLWQASSLREHVANVVAFSGPAMVPRTASARVGRTDGPKPGYAGSDISADGLCQPRGPTSEVLNHAGSSKADCTTVSACDMTSSPKQRVSLEVSQDDWRSHTIGLHPVTHEVTETEGCRAENLDLVRGPSRRAPAKGWSHENDGDETETQVIPTAGELSDVTCGPNAFVRCSTDGDMTRHVQQSPPKTCDESACNQVQRELDGPHVLPR